MHFTARVKQYNVRNFMFIRHNPTLASFANPDPSYNDTNV